MNMRWRVFWLSSDTWMLRGLCLWWNLRTLWRSNSSEFTRKKGNISRAQKMSHIHIKLRQMFSSQGFKLTLKVVSLFILWPGSCCQLVWTAGGSWVTSSSPTNMQSSCVPKPNTAPSVPSCAACRVSGWGVRLEHFTQAQFSTVQYNSNTLYSFNNWCEAPRVKGQIHSNNLTRPPPTEY